MKSFSKSILFEENAFQNVVCKISFILLGLISHDGVIKWKHFPRYWPFVRGIHRSPVNSPHKGQWRGALILSLICTWINGWVNNGEAGDLIRHRVRYDVIVMSEHISPYTKNVKRTCLCSQYISANGLEPLGSSTPAGTVIKIFRPRSWPRHP